LDLLFDLGRGVRDQDSRVRNRRRHLLLGSLECWEELRVVRGALLEFELVSDVSGHSEVGVLVDGSGDEAGDVGTGAVDVGEGGAEGGDGLNSGEGVFTNWVVFFEAEGSLDLVIRDVFLDFEDVFVELVDIPAVREDKSLLGVEAKRDYVLDVVDAHVDGAGLSFEFQVLLEQVLLVVGDLDDKGNVEHLLQPLGENHGDAVTHVEGTFGRTTAGVQIEGLLLFVGSEDLVEVTMTEEESSTDELVEGTVSDSLLDALVDAFADRVAAEFVNQLRIIDTLVSRG